METQASVSPYELARYPFIPAAEAYLKEVGFTLEDASLPSIIGRAKERIMTALEGKKIGIKIADKDSEIISFYVAMLLVRATGSGWLSRVYSRAEGDRSSDAFREEGNATVCHIVNQLFGMKLQQVDRLPWQTNIDLSMRIEFVAPLSSYLRVTSKLEQLDNPNLTLAENIVYHGKIYLTKEKVLAVVEDQFAALILANIRKLKVPPNLPKEMAEVVEDLAAKLPKPRKPDASRFQYIEKILKANIQDGRHRILWLILPPYMVNVKHMTDEEAMEAIKNYMDRVGWRESRADRIIRYNIKRARRIGLMPPTLERLEQTSPGLYKIIVDSIRSVS